MATNTQSKTTININDISSTVELCTKENYDNGASNEQTEKDDRSTHLATTDGEALIHVMKSSLGAGVLAMPVAYKSAGLIEGLIGTIIVGIICTHGTHLLVKASQKMCATLKRKSLGYGETVEAVFLTSSHTRIRSTAPFAKAIANIFLFITYFGSDAVYVVMIASSVQEVSQNQLSIEWNIRWFIVLCVIPLLIVGTIRSMKYLVPFSVLANVLLFIGLVITFYYILNDLPPLNTRPYTVECTKFPLFFTTVLAGLEGIGTILPIENSMKNPQHFLGCPGVLNIGMSVVIFLFTTVGFFGYLKYGDNVRGSVILSLPPYFTAELIKLLVGLAILFTFGLQMTAAAEVVWSVIKNKIEKENQNSRYYIMRGCLVLCTVLCAIAVPQLAPVISLIGALGFSTLGFLIPGMLDIIILSENGINLSNITIWKNFLLIILAGFALIAGSYASILDIIHEYK